MSKILLLVALGLASMQVKTNTPPKRGDAVVVRGCLSGGVVEAGELTSADGEYKHLATHDYRLTGKKAMLKTLKDEHAHHVDILTGVLKTDLPTERRGPTGRIGNTGIGIGVGAAPGSSPRALPVLEVTAFEHVDVRCR